MQFSLLLTLATLIPATTGESTAATDGWTRFRGPNGTGVAEGATGLPSMLDPKQNLRWRTELPPGHSSPVLFGKHVFLTADDDGTLVTLCIARETGEVVWRKEAPRARETKIDQRNDQASPSAAVDAATVVVFFPDFGVLAYDHEGSELWRHPLGPFDNMYGMGASPILVAGKVVLACDQNLDSYVIALDQETGMEVWKSARPAAKSGHCTPIVRRSDGDEGALELLLPGSFYLDAYDVGTGERRWWVSGLSFEMKSVPVLADGVVYVNGYGSPMNQPGNQVEVPDFVDVVKESDKNGDGAISQDEMPRSRASAWFDFVDLDHDGVLADAEWVYLQDALGSLNGMHAIRPGERGDCTETNVLWSYHRAVPQLPSPLVYHDLLYMLNDSGGLLTTFRPKSGEIVERGRLTQAVDEYYASPVAGDDKVYLVSLSGIVSVLPADGSLEPLSTTELGESVYATPAIGDGTVFVRTTAALYCFE